MKGEVSVMTPLGRTEPELHTHRWLVGTVPPSNEYELCKQIGSKTMFFNSRSMFKFVDVDESFHLINDVT